MKKLDIIQFKFGRLTVIEKMNKNKHGNYTWLCECECKNKIIVSGGRLLKGTTKSCGCYRIESLKKRNKKHGFSGKRLYSIYNNIKSRCYNVNNIGFNNYGGRGISMCDEWLNSIESFYKWALSSGYEEKLSIDRIDNNGNYEAKNCRWITTQEQNRNRRSNVFYRNECALDASLRLGGNKNLVRERISRGWSIEKAFTTPIINNK